MPSRGSFSSHKLEHRILGGLLLGAGLLLLIVIIQMLLPWLLLASLGLFGVWIWQRQQNREKELHQTFYALLKTKRGRISALDFAMSAHLTGAKARQFLDARAKEFHANFEPTDQGDILYTFIIAQPPSAVESPPEKASGPTLGEQEPALSPVVPAAMAAAVALKPEALAERMKCSATLIHQKKWAADFAAWSRAHDPEQWAWTYDPLSDYCYRITSAGF